jgi:pantetheine-phosphate adenylyltransferase
MTAKSTGKTIAIYPGTFDPITNGHIDIITRGLNLFDKIIVAIASNPGKEPLFSLEERIEMINKSFEDNPLVEADYVPGLLVKYAADSGARAIIRGLRAVSDFDYEFQLALMNRKLERTVESVFLMPGFRWIYISSSIVKDAARHGGDILDMVPEHVHGKMMEKFSL